MRELPVPVVDLRGSDTFMNKQVRGQTQTGAWLNASNHMAATVHQLPQHVPTFTGSMAARLEVKLFPVWYFSFDPQQNVSPPAPGAVRPQVWYPPAAS